MRQKSPFYVERSVDQAVKDAVKKEAQTLVIKGPRQIGKSSLLARAHAAAKQNKQRSSYIDFQALDEVRLRDLNSLLTYLANRLARDFRATAKPAEFWDDLLGPKESITDFIESAILEDADGPVVLCLDEADRVFDCDFRDDFFSTIRYWHNRRTTNEVWDNLKIVIAHATEAASFIKDPNQSPFNVGERFVLPDFTEDQVLHLNKLHGNPLKTKPDLEAFLRRPGATPT